MQDGSDSIGFEIIPTTDKNKQQKRRELTKVLSLMILMILSLIGMGILGHVFNIAKNDSLLKVVAGTELIIFSLWAIKIVLKIPTDIHKIK